MARVRTSIGNARLQRINQAKYGDITVRHGKDKRSNVNKKLPIGLKQKNYETKAESRRLSMSSVNNRRRRVSRENINKNRITLSKFIRWSAFLTISSLCVWGYSTSNSPTVQRQRRSIQDVVTGIANKYIAVGYNYGQSAAAWTRQRRSNGAHSDDMSNPHNGATSDNESIIQKVFSDFAKLVKSESEGYVSGNNFKDNDNNNNNIKENNNDNNNNNNNNDL